MIQNLDATQLHQLLATVFGLRPEDRRLLILVDLPDDNAPDNYHWKDRRLIALEWFDELLSHKAKAPFREVYLGCFGNVGSNNNDLPNEVSLISEQIQDIAWQGGTPTRLEQILDRGTIVLALTEFSATAPLKNLGRRLKFRGATLPGFTRDMIPALSLDYEKVNERVHQIKNRMDIASGITIRVSCAGEQYESFFDLRFRSGHASGGLMREEGMVGNLPSGEAYIVPYEGEKQGEPSRTDGTLPVQFDDEIVIYKIRENRACKVDSSGKYSDIERSKLAKEPAYGNIAEIGMGVLGEWGVTAVGSTLLDEKLGLHIAFGRSEHFGGITGPNAFRDPKNVIHIDRVYVSSTQPLIQVDEAVFHYERPERTENALVNGKYLV